MWFKTWKPFLRWPILRPDWRDPLKHVKVALRLAGEPEKRTAMCLGFSTLGIAADASTFPFFEWLLALATTFHFEDPHALRTNAIASTNAISAQNFTG